jgi:hypothetical protein
MKTKQLQILNVIVACLFFATTVVAQTASHTPQQKNFLIEKGTGIACCSCPGIAAKCQAIIDTYPAGKGLLVEYHYGPDAKPQSGNLNKDYRTQFGDSILEPVWPFYLNMMVNRRDRGNPYGSTYIFGSTDQVTPECTTVAGQTAPVNIAMTSSYNSTTRVITVNVQAYYTANSATAKNYLQVMITEDGIVGPQCTSGFVYNFVHDNMFRANINGPLGVVINTTTSGTTVNKTFTYTVPAKYGTGASSGWITPNTANFKLTAFIAEDRTASGAQSLFGKIINVVRAPLGGAVMTDVESKESENKVVIYPNPSKGVFTLNTNTSGNYSYEVMDVVGRVVYKGQNNGNAESTIDLTSFPKGMYNVKVSSENNVSMHKIMLVD